MSVICNIWESRLTSHFRLEHMQLYRHHFQHKPALFHARALLFPQLLGVRLQLRALCSPSDMMGENPLLLCVNSESLDSFSDGTMEGCETPRDEHSREDALADIDEFPVYEYQSLPSNKHIRRLVLKPGTGRSQLFGTLQPMDLDLAASLTSFEAISYVWGSGIKDQFIVIDGKALPITTSLRESLLQVRLRNKARAVWADSICINQNNAAEKGEQVALMGRIYQTSTCTLICLGPEPEHQRQAIEAALLIQRVDHMISRVYDDSNFSWGWNTFPWPEADEPLLYDEAWTSWQTLVTRPWFLRGWVVQEAALGAMGVVFWAGIEIQWLSLLRVHYWLRWRARPRMPSFNVLWGILSLHQTAYKITCHREAKTFHPEHKRSRFEAKTILEIIDSARWLDLADPRDRIYAFMAMETRGKIPDLQPDYNPDRSYLDIYRHFAETYLASTSDLDILGFVEYDDDAHLHDGQIASWIPQWDQGKQIYTERNWFCAWKKINDIDILSGSNQQSFSIMQDGSLQVRGIIIDAVQYVSVRLKDPTTEKDALGELGSLWKDIAHQSTRSPGSQPTCLSLVFLSALARGEMEGQRDEWNMSLHTFASVLQYYRDHPQNSLTALTPPSNAARTASPLMRWSRNRRLALLGRGYCGNVPHVAREGDVCAIIYGTRTPFILRNVRLKGKHNCYRVVGAAYVVSKKVDRDGIPMRMGDDGCEDWREWSSPTSNIVLC